MWPDEVAHAIVRHAPARALPSLVSKPWWDRDSLSKVGAGTNADAARTVPEGTPCAA